MSEGGLSDDWNQRMAWLFKKLGIDENKLNEQPMSTNDQGVVTDVRANKDIWQEKVDKNWFAQAQKDAKAGVETGKEMFGEMGNEFRAVMQGLTGNEEVFPTDKYVPDDAFGRTKTQNSPMPAPGTPQPPLPTPQATPTMSGNKVSNFFEGAFDPATTYAKKVEQGRNADRQRKQQLDKHKRVSQEASSADRAMLSFARYSTNANTRSQMARQVTRDYDLGRSSRKGGLQEY